MAKIIIVGDFFPTEQNVAYFEKGDVNTLLGDSIIQLFVNADFSICNLEGALTDHDERCRKTGPVKVAPTKAIEAYRKLGIKCCLLANNHSTDGGHQGVLDTMNVLDESGIQSIGAGKCNRSITRSSFYEIGGLNVGLYNVSETMYNIPTDNHAGVWLYDEYVVCNEIKELKQKCDYLIVVYHGGIEKFPFPSPEMRKRFHRMADSGANIILSQHTHCVGCEEWYNGSYLLYGQGDFLLKNFAPGLTDTGLIIELDIHDRKVQIKKHLVNSIENMFVRYSEQQNFDAFDERSRKVKDEKYVKDQLQKYCDNELRLYLTAFKSPSRFRLLQKRFFPSSYRKWLYSYTQKNLMFTLHTLRSEQNRETAIIGLEGYLEKFNLK